MELNSILNKYILFSAIFLVIFSGCTTKEVFEPKNINTPWAKYEVGKSSIVDASSNVALLQDGTILTKSNTLNVDINATHRVISQSDGWIISASIDGNLLLVSQEDENITIDFDLKKTVAGASISANTLAIIFADNEIALYNTDSKELIFKEQGSKYLATDSRIVNPHFMNDLVLFSTLDGKVIIVNKMAKKRLRTVIVSSEDSFNNVISLNILENKIIAATSYAILSIEKKEIRAKYEIRNIAYDEKNVFVATKQGEIISLTSDLQVDSKLKFPFAHFYGMISKDDKLYVLEKEGYMIVIDKNSFEYKVHEIDLDNGLVFISDQLFYVDDKKISVE